MEFSLPYAIDTFIIIKIKLIFYLMCLNKRVETFAFSGVQQNPKPESESTRTYLK